MSKNIVIGIDVGSSAIKIVAVEQKKGSQGFHVLGASKKGSVGIRRGYVSSTDEVTKSIRATVEDAEKSLSSSIRRAYVAIGGIGLESIKSKGMIMISRPDGKVTEYDIKRVVEQSESNLTNISNKSIIHSFPLNFKIDNNIVLGRPVGMRGSKLEVETLFVVCLSQHLDDLVKTVEDAGISIEDIVAAPLAASASVLTPDQKEAGCVLANIGASTLSLVVYEEGRPISLEVFPIGSTHITNDIALGFQIPLTEAEQLKIEYGSDSLISKRRLSDIIEARLNDIFELIESHLKKINRNGLLPAGVILTGGGSSLVTLEDIAKVSLRLPVTIGSPFKSAGHGVTVSRSSKEQLVNNPEWSVVFGLCVTGFNEEMRVGFTGGRLISKASTTFKGWLRSLLP